MTPTGSTHFACAARSSREELGRQRALFGEEAFFCEVVSRLPDVVLVLNANRQLVYANQAALALAGAPDPDRALGARPGELLDCIHAGGEDTGCGTSPFCRYCGAVAAILSAQAGTASSQDCRILVHRGSAEEALDLRVWAIPIALKAEPFTVFVVADIADEKRRAVLERLFLHDLSNTVNSIQIISQLLDSGALKEGAREDYIHRVCRLSERLMEEIEAQRTLLAAESGELETRPAPVHALEVLEEILRAFDCRDVLNGRFLVLGPEREDPVLRTDPALLGRVLRNMVKNALEASVPGDTVVMGCRREDGGVSFLVHNPTSMPEKIRLQVFKRSFSTKGPGRGLGTYGMKYLSERHLRGRVDFTSTEAEGTTFRAWYPLA